MWLHLLSFRSTGHPLYYCCHLYRIVDVGNSKVSDLLHGDQDEAVEVGEVDVVEVAQRDRASLPATSSAGEIECLLVTGDVLEFELGCGRASHREFDAVEALHVETLVLEEDAEASPLGADDLDVVRSVQSGIGSVDEEPTTVATPVADLRYYGAIVDHVFLRRADVGRGGFGRCSGRLSWS